MHWEIILNCVADPKKWEQIPLPLKKDLSIGTGFERALHHAGQKLKKLANSDKEVTFWIRGDVLLVSNGKRRLKTIGTRKASSCQIEGAD
jgi:hypothetical protein